jgi:hypothetical protein
MGNSSGTINVRAVCIAPCPENTRCNPAESLLETNPPPALSLKPERAAPVSYARGPKVIAVQHIASAGAGFSRQRKRGRSRVAVSARRS